MNFYGCAQTLRQGICTTSQNLRGLLSTNFKGLSAHISKLFWHKNQGRKIHDFQRVWHANWDKFVWFRWKLLKNFTVINYSLRNKNISSLSFVYPSRFFQGLLPKSSSVNFCGFTCVYLGKREKVDWAHLSIYDIFRFMTVANKHAGWALIMTRFH